MANAECLSQRHSYSERGTVKAIIEGVSVEGTPDEIAGLIHAMSPKRGSVTANLTPSERETYEALYTYVEGAHYEVLARKMGITPAAANSRLQSLYVKKLVDRVRSGIYIVVRDA